jgi:AbiV family abortive infection protein
LGVTPTVLLQGAWFAFEQCGILLRDAVRLYARGSRATAVGLALLAREELGKARISLDFWRATMYRGQNVSARDLRTKLDDHEEKQRKSQISQFWSASGPSRVDTLVRIVASSPSVQARAAASKELEELGKIQQKRAPADRHRARMRALYVDLNATGTGWDRPRDMPGDLGEILDRVSVDYSLQWYRFDGPRRSLHILKHDEPKLAEAIKAWRDRPRLPKPARRKFRGSRTP